MKKQMFSVLLVFICSILFIACGGGGDAAPVNDSDSAVVTDNNDAATVNDSDTAAPATKPGNDFFVPEKNMRYEFKGYLNKYEDINSANEVKGAMDMTFKFGEFDLTLNDQPTAFVYTYPETASETLRGRTVAGIFSVGNIEQKDGLVIYYLFGGDFNIVKLKELKAKGAAQFNNTDSDATASVQKYYLKNRADGSNVLRRCLKAVISDKEESKFFINSTANTGFAVGESFLVWGNVAFSSEFSEETKSKLTDYNGELCSFSLNKVPITKEEYDIEMNKDVTQFDCEMPADFMTPKSEKYAIVKIKGKINPAQSDTSTTGSCKVKADDTVMTLEDILKAQSGKTETGEDVITLDGAGNIEALGSQTHYKYKYMQTIIMRSLLEKEKSAGKESILLEDILSNPQTGSVLYDVEEKQLSTKTLQKVCIAGMPDKAPAVSSIFMCIKNNKDFVDGEEIQGAAYVSMNTDESYLFELMKVDSKEKLCNCSSYTQTDYTPAADCTEFNAN